MFLAPREVLQGKRKFLVVHDPQIAVDTRGERHARFRLAVRDDGCDVRMVHKHLHETGSVVLLRAQEDIDVPYHLFPAAETPRDFAPDDARLLRQNIEYRVRRVQRGREEILILSAPER